MLGRGWAGAGGEGAHCVTLPWTQQEGAEVGIKQAAQEQRQDRDASRYLIQVSSRLTRQAVELLLKRRGVLMDLLRWLYPRGTPHVHCHAPRPTCAQGLLGLL